MTLIRFCYNQLATNPQFQRITFAFFGVATPSDLITDNKRTPFNIGKAIDLQRFTLDSAQPLAVGLADIGDSQTILGEILNWTKGQPFLTQKLCQLVVNATLNTTNKVTTILADTEASRVENIVRKYMISDWES